MALPWLELHVFAAVCRLYGRENSSVTTNVIDTTFKGRESAGTGAIIRKEIGVTVGEIVRELDRMTGALRKGDFTEDRMHQALVALADEESLLALVSTSKPAPAQGLGAGAPFH